MKNLNPYHTWLYEQLHILTLKPPAESVRDRKTIQAEGTKSPELKALTTKFLAFHGASYGCNMATIATSVAYGLCVAARGL